MNNLEIFPTSANAINSGVFIPLTNLVGMVGGDLSETGVILEGKLTYAFLNSLFESFSQSPPLGFPDVEKSDPTGTGLQQYSEAVTLRIQRFIDLRDGSVFVPPKPTIGSYSGQGGKTLDDIWDGASLVTAGQNPGDAGVLIPNSWITGWGGDIPSFVDTDSRSWLAAFILAINHTIAVRSTTVASAIIRKTNPAAIRPTGPAIPAEFYDPTNPTSGIIPDDLPYLRFIQEAIVIEYEVESDPSDQTFEVLIRTA